VRLFKKLRKKLTYLPPDKIDDIQRAYLLAADAHKNQTRRSGEPYISHPVAVASILADQKMDAETIMAALLHDVIEDTPVTKNELADAFGIQVAELVDGVSKLTQIEFVSRAQMQAENFRKMVLAMSKDIRVILVKLADRLHNMRTLGVLSAQKRRRIGMETLEIYAPIAKRLGMRDFSVELEELSFEAAYPLRFRVLKAAVAKARGNRKKILKTISDTLKASVENSSLPACKIIGREKHVYSIYRKMRKKQLSFSQVMDVYAFRTIVDTTDNCYRMLGVVHNTYKPVLDRFKDYIAIPKTNGYQSLHTTLFGPYGLPIEIQIRTTDMERMANMGIAAHWLYKSEQSQTDDIHLRAQEWVANLLELQNRTGSSMEFIENVKIDLFPNEIYVFTPKGAIKQLPANATPVDFAYEIHTDIGNATVGVKIDRQLAPLSTPLMNGQTVEIVTSPLGSPNPTWLDFVVTSAARSGIRHFLKTRKKADSIRLGQKLFKNALSEISIAWRQVSDDYLNQLVSQAQLDSIDDLYEAIGLANRVAAIEAHHVANMIQGEADSRSPNQSVRSEPLVIKGTEGVSVKFSSCCYPLPGDPIIGLMRSGKGVSIHRENCYYTIKLREKGEVMIPMCWDSHIDRDFQVAVEVEAENKRGILATVALAVSDAQANIEDISMQDKDGQFKVTLMLLVKSRQHLAAVLRSVRRIQGILSIVTRR
jgi:guanosine-3',5'-bis(diphosphate) 3'-pyrophosphohydrolase